MSGPHQGQTLEATAGPTEFHLPHPTEPGIHCRYSINDGDGPINGLPDTVQLHYVGDIATTA
ncbi:hypothetical protein [Streptomyces cylindrosporus]|uniref:Uncharacterized protein n=1 Tax=Streptomyces cylindrosporus TaxID=2927583 RepID=A0ABS9Y4H9_9ACTN|nr:hypothetical protein [Streptomyces cylindrosporus]MCI3271405.1 hypothetical protein [Streptomyces cylindrosporus]